MKIKDSENVSFFASLGGISKFLKSLFSKTLIKVFLLIFICSFLSSYFFWLGAFKRIDGSLGRYRVFVHGMYKKNVIVAKNFILGKLSKPEKLQFNIDFESMNSIHSKLDILKQNKKPPDSKMDEFYKAELIYNNSEYKTSIKLVGGEMDHFSSDKWSFRCKIKDKKSILGMREFNLMHPSTRLYISSWVCNELYRKNDFVNINYHFVDVVINGDSKGIYILEEWFDKPMIEKDGNRAGLIFRPSSDGLKVFKENKVKKDSSLINQLSYLNNVYNRLIKGDLEPKSFFDYNKFSKHFAYLDLLNGKHSLYHFNLIWYFNPLTKLVEPIAREWSSRSFSKIESLTYDHKDDMFINKIFSDKNFVRLYFDELQNVASSKYVINFFNEIKSDKDSILNIIYKDYPYYDYSMDYLIRNQKYLNKRLNDFSNDIVTNLDIDNQNDLKISIKNFGILDCQIHSLELNGKEKKFDNNFILEGNGEKHLFLNDLYEFRDLNNLENLFIKYSLPQINELKVYTKNIFIPNNNIFFKNHIRYDVSKNSIFEYDINLNDSLRIIELPKVLELNEVVVVPPNFKLLAKAGTIIKLNKYAGIVSYSPILFKGEKNNPIFIKGDNAISNGILIKETIKDTSKLIYTHFSGLTNLYQKNWGITGSITFFKSPVNFKNCVFEDNSVSDDLVNIIKTDFKIIDCTFKNSNADALDADFATGEISHSKFYNIGNDALDFSGSIINILDTEIVNAKDKALSAGEGTTVFCKNIFVKDCEIGLTSKDDSSIFANEVKMANSKIGYCAYNKKSIYGSGVISVEKSLLKNIQVPYLIEKGSSLVIEDKVVKIVENSKVKDLLYGEKYGKAS